MTNQTKPLRIACTAINKRIMAGRIAKNGMDFIGNPIDVTSDCMKAVIDKVGIGGKHVITMDGVAAYEIEIRLCVPPTTSDLSE